MITFTDFFQGKAAAGGSGRDMDFNLPADSDRPLSPEQLSYLAEASHYPIPAVFTIRQVHGSGIVVAAKKDLANQPPFPEADGVITREKDLPIAVRTADCLPVFLYDPVQEAIGLVHAGWRGTRERILEKVLAKMVAEWGTRAEDVLAAFGPAIGPCCYEVGEEFQDYFSGDAVRRDGRIFLDLPKANRRQLTAAGVRPGNIKECGICTSCRDEWFSYRREGPAAGRHLSWMVLLKA